jgi:hypothetical protein
MNIAVGWYVLLPGWLQDTGHSSPITELTEHTFGVTVSLIPLYRLSLEHLKRRQMKPLFNWGAFAKGGQIS